jgi:ribonuclease HII
MDDVILVCGVDEAGRGPLAGPVYAAAVILDKKRRINGLADSKVLTAERRDVLAGRIKERAIAWAVATATVEEIDRINIFHASMLAMRRAVHALGVAPEEAWIDGNQCPRELGCRAKAIVDGDALHPVISAASILAKTERDAEMCSLSVRYPQYGFDRHKGYATAEHLDALGRIGPCEIHRRSFHAVGVFFQRDLFTNSWGSMAEPLRVRSYRMYCEAVKLAAGAGLAGERGGSRLTAAKARLVKFNLHEKRLKREYTDVLASAEASQHIELMDTALREAREQLRGQIAASKVKRPD